MEVSPHTIVVGKLLSGKAMHSISIPANPVAEVYIIWSFSVPAEGNFIVLWLT
jgi:hypothetical protein